jgi:ABC-type nitrate/sulfonate/bicarbonate transport system substrate-binding protein/outer membrane protein OmpA-like peptidoglycan-associated protein
MNLKSTGKLTLAANPLFALLLIMLLLCPHEALAAGNIEYLQPKPLYDCDTLKGVHLKPVKGGVLKIPLITWPGDVATIYTDQLGLFKKEGLDVQLFLENDFAKQVKAVLEGETPLLRGTMGMVNAAAETFAKQGTELVVLYQLTWSTGGDCLVVRPGVKSLTDLKGKNVALQLYGPHMDYLTTVLKKAGLRPTDVHARWLKELSVPAYDTHGKIVDPRSAFEAAADLDGAMVISPDANALTSGGTGTGAEGSVRGARVLFSSKSANRVISDVYAVRADYFKANRARVERFVHALMLGQEQFSKLLANKSSDQGAYKKLVSRSAELLFGSPQAVADVEGSLGGDCEWVGYSGNVSFFTGAGTTRTFAKLKDEIQSSFLELGLLKSKAPLQTAGWDYKAMAAGLANSKVAVAPKQAFDPTKAQRQVEKEIASGVGKWEKEGSLYSFEIYFAPRQAGFTAAQYSDAFKKALELSQTLGGTLITIEGHNSPDALNKAKADGKSDTQIALIEQAAKNLSYQRAIAVRQAYLDFCKQAGVPVDESQFLAVGMGTSSPKFPVPKTEEQWNANRRVVFRVKSVETELDSFKPSGK